MASACVPNPIMRISWLFKCWSVWGIKCLHFYSAFSTLTPLSIYNAECWMWNSRLQSKDAIGVRTHTASHTQDTICGSASWSWTLKHGLWRSRGRNEEPNYRTTHATSWAKVTWNNRLIITVIPSISLSRQLRTLTLSPCTEHCNVTSTVVPSLSVVVCFSLFLSLNVWFSCVWLPAGLFQILCPRYRSLLSPMCSHLCLHVSALNTPVKFLVSVVY